MSEGFQNAVIGGASVLIRKAIQSANYVAGVAGWIIGKDGTAEFNNATIRGTVVAGGGAVTLNSSGLHITAANTQYDINQNAGFLARRLPDDGSFAQLTDIVNGNNNAAGGILFLEATTPSAHGHTISAGSVWGDYNTSGTVDSPFLFIESPSVNPTNITSKITLFGADSSATVSTDNSFIEFTANQYAFDGNGNVVTNRPRWVADWGTPSIPNNAVTTLTPATVNVNTGGMGSGSTITIPTIDVWDIGCVLRFATNNVGNRMVRILLNGAELNSFVIPSISGFNTTALISIKPLLQAGDQIQFTAFQSSGAALSLTGGGNKAWVMKELA